MEKTKAGEVNDNKKIKDKRRQMDVHVAPSWEVSVVQDGSDILSAEEKGK